MLADGVAQYLTELGLADYRPGTDGGDTGLGYMPPTPDVWLVVTDTGGDTPYAGLPLGLPGFQLRARGAEYDYGAPHRWLRDLIAALHDLRHVTLPNGLGLVVCDANQTQPAPWGLDGSNRWEFSVNFTCRTWRQ